MLMTCELAKWRVVGRAEPQPNMFTSNFSIRCKGTFLCAFLRYVKGEILSINAIGQDGGGKKAGRMLEGCWKNTARIPQGSSKEAGRKQKRSHLCRHDLRFIWYGKNYFLAFSICSFNATKASMSPKVVEAAWFWIETDSSFLLFFLATLAAFFSALASALAASSKIRL